MALAPWVYPSSSLREYCPPFSLGLSDPCPLDRTVIAQLVFTFGGSGFAGGIGRMMIEIVVRLLRSHPLPPCLQKMTPDYSSRSSTSSRATSPRLLVKKTPKPSSPPRLLRFPSPPSSLALSFSPSENCASAPL